MRSQGWEPGQYLGAQDAAQADSYTAANASYIRVSLKDDMKGLGFNKAKEDQVTGLDIFSDLLSRLNGKSEEEVEDGRQARMAVKANIYVEQRWGPMRFVRGGLLVGDEVKGLEEKESNQDSSSSDETMEEAKPKKSKKRKAAEQEEEEETESSKKKRRKEERRKQKALAQEEADASEDVTKTKKKAKKSKKSKSEDASEENTPAPEEETKAERKERKRAKKEKKRKRKEAQESEGDTKTTAAPSAVGSGISTPTGTGTSTPVRPNRNFVRSRFIAQKKEALLDAKALNQVSSIESHRLERHSVC